MSYSTSFFRSNEKQQETQQLLQQTASYHRAPFFMYIFYEITRIIMLLQSFSPPSNTRKSNSLAGDSKKEPK